MVTEWRIAPLPPTMLFEKTPSVIRPICPSEE